MSIHLSPVEARILGALIEKEATTPEYYPLSINALIAACNQKNNRDPLMQVDEEQIRQGLNQLRDQNLAAALHESRVTKYEHRLQEVLNLSRGETAVLCVLLLRGPQTPGELRGRTERMYSFEQIDDVLAVLDKLMQHEPALAAALQRQPGSREVRYAHLLSGEPENLPAAAPMAIPMPAGSASEEGRLARLETEVGELRQEVAELKAHLAAFLSPSS
jgi:uncharacterized protein YceH (UPF0502 family)